MKVAFLLPHLGPCQSSFRLIYNINKILKDRTDLDIIIFYENQVKPCLSPQFAIMNIADAWNYNGNLITTTLHATYKALKFPGPTRKYFYVVDMEWIYIPKKNYKNLAEVYQNNNIKLLSRSNEHANRISEAWSVPIRGIVKDFDIESLIKIIEDDNDTGKNKTIL